MKQIHLYTSEEKIKHLGEGEWVEEPDKIEFNYKGYDCIVWRIFCEEPYALGHFYGGFLCGYVKLPVGHEYYEKNYMEITIDCHGGVTYGDFHTFNNENEDTDYYIGFNCAHAEDYHPSMEKFKKTDPIMMAHQKEMDDLLKNISAPDTYLNRFFNKTYKNISFCIEECKSIVDQLTSEK